jgi:hypothetical protein
MPRGTSAEDVKKAGKSKLSKASLHQQKRLFNSPARAKNEDFSAKRKGKREYLNDSQTRALLKDLNRYFQSKVRIPRIRIGDEQEIETLLSEEALLFAMFLREERQMWEPRIVGLPS